MAKDGYLNQTLIIEALNMTKFVISETFIVTETYIVEADSLEEALEEANASNPTTRRIDEDNVITAIHKDEHDFYGQEFNDCLENIMDDQEAIDLAKDYLTK